MSILQNLYPRIEVTVSTDWNGGFVWKIAAGSVCLAVGVAASKAEAFEAITAAELELWNTYQLAKES